MPNALAQFASQTQSAEHEFRLIVLDDAGQFGEQHHANWDLRVTDQRFPSLSAKLNELVRLAKQWGADAVALWEDDDVYLPDHLRYHADRLVASQWSIPRKKYVDVHRRPEVDPSRLQLIDLRCETREQPWCHGSWAFRVGLWEKVGGYDETKSSGFDLDFGARCLAAAGKPADYTNVMFCQEPQYVYRWNSHGYVNGTALGDDYFAKAATTGDGERVTGEVIPKFDAGTLRLRKILGVPDAIPVFITNRDRLGWVRDIVAAVNRLPGAVPVIVDNASTYPPLLEWYASQAECRVFRLTENKGPRAAWSVKDEVVGDGGHYVVTDNDLDLSQLPADTMSVLRGLLDSRSDIHKAGLALRIDDLPDTEQGRLAREAESKYWDQSRRFVDPNGREMFNAALDTTFAMYRQTPAYLGQYEPAIRVAGRYTARHLPWYVTPATIADDDRHYLANASMAGLFYSPRMANELAQQGQPA